MIALAAEQRVFDKGVDLEWGSYTPLHLKSNPVPNPLLLKEWSVANPLHSLHWIGLWSGVSRSEPVSAHRSGNLTRQGAPRSVCLCLRTFPEAPVWQFIWTRACLWTQPPSGSTPPASWRPWPTCTLTMWSTGT